MSYVLERLRELRAKRQGRPIPGSGSRPDGVGSFTSSSFHSFTVTHRGYLVPDELPQEWQEWYEERAAVREYQGGQTREHAEADALRETLAAMRQAGENPCGAP